MTDKKRIFISHATDNDALVDEIAHQLDPHLTLWIDHRHGFGLSPNDPDWEYALRTAIGTCDAGVFIMTEKSLKSKVCKAECLLVQNLNKPLFVIRADTVQFADIWLTISLIQYADWVKHPDKAITDLISAINGKTGADIPTRLRKFTDAGDIPTHQPYIHNPLRGRLDDVAWVTDNLKPIHITQITGTGGQGKSRLAIEFALNDPNGAVWFRCELGKNSADLQKAMREHANLPEGADLDLILDQLQPQNPLIVVDNAEAVSDFARADYVSLLNKLVGKGLRVLLTSRKAWQEFRPRIDRPLGALDEADGVALTRDFATTEKIALDEGQIRDLARASHHYPRLIEFAIRQLHEFEYAVILKRLNSLNYGIHADMQAVLDEMITKTVDQMATEKHGDWAEKLLKRLTWLTATFPKTVIVALKPDDMDESAVDDALALLRRYQFVRYADNRYALADLVREALGTDPTVFPIYADFYTVRAEEIFDDLPPEEWGDQEGGGNVDDITNIKGLGDALMYRTEDGTKGEVARALEFAVMTRRYVQLRMEAGAWAWLEMGLTAVQTLSKSDNADEMLIGHEALLLGELGHVYVALGENQKALAYQQKALLMAVLLGDKGGEATALNNIAGVYYALGDNQKALDYFEQLLPLARMLGNKSGEATALNNIGMAYGVLGKKLKALDYFEQALLIVREVGDKLHEGMTLNNIAGVYYDLGEKRKALDYLEQTLPLSRAVGNRGGEALICLNIGMVYHNLGDLDKAIEYVERAIHTTYDKDPNLEIFHERLMFLKRKSSDANMSFKSTPTLEETQALSNYLIEIYQVRGEDAMCDMLKQNNVSDEDIDNLVAVVKEQLGEPMPPPPSDTLPFDLIQNWLQNTYTVLKSAPEKRDEWRDALENHKVQMSNMGDDWAKEAQFVEALLALLRGESPVLAGDNPYADAVRQLVTALGE